MIAALTPCRRLRGAIVIRVESFERRIGGGWLTAALGGMIWLSMAMTSSASPAVPDGRVEAELVSRATALVPGETAPLGLRLQMDPGWHTYWKNPGDSGMATQLQWDLPDGYEVSGIEWPAPDYFELGGLASYAYEGEIVLPVSLRVPPAAGPGASVTLRATADWLVCKQTCEPGMAALALTLPVVARPVDAEPDLRWAELFAWADARQPGLEPGVKVRALSSGDGYRLTVDDPALDFARVTADAFARFFTADPMALDMVAPQPMTAAEGVGLHLELDRPTHAPRAAERLPGVLVYRDGGPLHVYAVDVPVLDQPARVPASD
jgi:thiol:disulfide interchange protein DsbD